MPFFYISKFQFLFILQIYIAICEKTYVHIATKFQPSANSVKRK